MYPGIELRLYRYFSVLAEELNFTQAAMRLHVSEPTLSTQIRDLEREIDVKLFERTRALGFTDFDEGSSRTLHRLGLALSVKQMPRFVWKH